MRKSGEKLTKKYNHEKRYYTQNTNTLFSPINDWTKNEDMSWATTENKEVWWDEIGYFVIKEEERCISKD